VQEEKNGKERSPAVSTISSGWRTTPYGGGACPTVVVSGSDRLFPTWWIVGEE